MCNEREESKPIGEQYKDYIDELKQKTNVSAQEQEPLTIVKRTPVEGTAYDKVEFNREMTFSELKQLCSSEGMTIHEKTIEGEKSKDEPPPLPEIDSARIHEEIQKDLDDAISNEIHDMDVNEEGIRENIKKSGIHMTEEEIQATVQRARKRLNEMKNNMYPEPFDPNKIVDPTEEDEDAVLNMTEEQIEKAEADTSSDLANGYYKNLCAQFSEIRNKLNTKDFDELVNRIKQDLHTCEPGVDELPTLLYSGQPDMTARIMVDGKPYDECPRITQQQVDALNAEVKKVNDSFKITPGMNFAKDDRKKDERKCGHVKGSCWCDESEQPKPTKLGYLKTVVSDMPKSMVDKIFSIPGEYWSVSSVDGDGSSVQIRYNADNVKRNISIDVYPQYSDQEEQTEKKEKNPYQPVFFRIQYNQYGIAPLSYSFFCYNEKQMFDKGPNARRLYGWVTAMLVKFYQK